MLPYYYSVSEYLKDTYGKKLYKLSLSGNMTCPNRDGKLGTRGCIFCSGHGSGDFAVKDIDKAKTLVSNKYSGSEYIAYFQSLFSHDCHWKEEPEDLNFYMFLKSFCSFPDHLHDRHPA